MEARQHKSSPWPRSNAIFNHVGGVYYARTTQFCLVKLKFKTSERVIGYPWIVFNQLSPTLVLLREGRWSGPPNHWNNAICTNAWARFLIRTRVINKKLLSDVYLHKQSVLLVRSTKRTTLATLLTDLIISPYIDICLWYK